LFRPAMFTFCSSGDDSRPACPPGLPGLPGQIPYSDPDPTPTPDPDPDHPTPTITKTKKGPRLSEAPTPDYLPPTIYFTLSIITSVELLGS
jgi:hypothetical protein